MPLCCSASMDSVKYLNITDMVNNDTEELRNNLRKTIDEMEMKFLKEMGHKYTAGGKKAIECKISELTEEIKKALIQTTVQFYKVSPDKSFGAEQDLLKKVEETWGLSLLETSDIKESQYIAVFCTSKYRTESDVHAVMERMKGGVESSLSSPSSSEDESEPEEPEDEAQQNHVRTHPPVKEKDLKPEEMKNELSKSAESEDGKPTPVILVVMHHTRDIYYETAEKQWSDSYPNVVLSVDILFHKTEGGLLKCPKNDEAVEKMGKFLKTIKKETE